MHSYMGKVSVRLKRRTLQEIKENQEERKKSVTWFNIIFFKKSDISKGVFVTRGQKRKEKKKYREQKVNKNREEKSWPKDRQMKKCK